MYCDWPVLRRCCFCMPLRRGVLVFAYLNLVYSGLLISLYSYAVHKSLGVELVYHSMSVNLPAELCIIIYILEMSFNAVLIYGAHKKIYKYVKAFYYYAVSTTLAMVLLFGIEVATLTYTNDNLAELLVFGFAGFFIQVYLLILVWNLLKKLEEDGPNAYENQLHQVTNGQTNGVV